jgi:hypothetical protein
MNYNFSLVKDFMNKGSNHQIISFFIYKYEISLSFSLVVFNRKPFVNKNEKQFINKKWFIH